MKSIWKSKKKVDIQVAGQNLFLISFDLEEDLEMIMEGRSWIFRKKLVLFNRIVEPIERNKIQLAMSPYWVKVGPCSPKCDRKDLSHAIGSTFGGVIRAKSKGDFIRIRVWLDVQKSLRRGIFALTETQQKCWVPFKYENLLGFCFGCGRLGNNMKDCCVVSYTVKNFPKDDYPFSVALKAEFHLVGKISVMLGLAGKKKMA